MGPPIFTFRSALKNAPRSFTSSKSKERLTLRKPARIRRTWLSAPLNLLVLSRPPPAGLGPLTRPYGAIEKAAGVVEKALRVSQKLAQKVPQ